MQQLDAAARMQQLQGRTCITIVPPSIVWSGIGDQGDGYILACGRTTAGGARDGRSILRWCLQCRHYIC